MREDIFANGAGYAAFSMAVQRGASGPSSVPQDTYSGNVVELEFELTVAEPAASLASVEYPADGNSPGVAPPPGVQIRQVPLRGTYSDGPNPNYVNHVSPSHGQQTFLAPDRIASPGLRSLAVDSVTFAAPGPREVRIAARAARAGWNGLGPARRTVLMNFSARVLVKLIDYGPTHGQIPKHVGPLPRPPTPYVQPK
ncbi:MAG: hypothetical protein GXP16_01770 [Gammaproteobacteria bacterium]|nr:hypothetical protein [Gammaproteobacteria bacterium]